jgi:predicted MFS family arabinose efflux permease
MTSDNRAILLLALAAFSSSSAFRLCDPMLPSLVAEFGTSTGEAARAVTAFAVGYGVLQMFFGPIGDRYGKYRVVCLATFLCALGALGAVLSTSLDMLVASRALSGATGAGVVPLAMAWIGDNVPYERRQATLARFLTGTVLGMAFGQMAGGWFADTLNWRWAFATLLALYLAVGTLLLVEVRRQSALGLGKGLGAGSAGLLAQGRQVLGVPWARVVLVMVFFEGLFVFGALAFVPAYLHLRFGISLTHAGIVGALYALGGFIYTLVAGRVIQLLGERGLVVAGGIGLCLAYLCYLLGPSWHWSVPASLLSGFSYYLLHATLQTNATQMVPAARGTAVAWFASCLFLGQAVGVAIAGTMIDVTGIPALFLISAVAVLVLGLSFSRALLRRSATIVAMAG